MANKKLSKKLIVRKSFVFCSPGRLNGEENTTSWRKFVLLGISKKSYNTISNVLLSRPSVPRLVPENFHNVTDTTYKLFISSRQSNTTSLFLAVLFCLFVYCSARCLVVREWDSIIASLCQPLSARPER